METKINSLKNASKVISIISKIAYTAMIVVIGICIAMLIFLSVTDGKTSKFTIGKTNIIVFEQFASTPAEMAAICAILIVTGGLFLAIFLLAYRMFHEISQTGEPFLEKYIKNIRTIGILTAALPIVLGIIENFTPSLNNMELPDICTDLPGIGVGAIIFCLSYIIDYGCGLKATLDKDLTK